MASFDIVSKIDLQTLDNVVNTTRKEIDTRFDFRNSNSEIDLDKKNYIIHLLTSDDMKLEQMEQMLIGRMVKNKLDPTALDFGKEQYASGKMIKKDVTVKQGIDKETSKKIVKAIKDSKIKVQASIMDEQVRVTGKKLDDLQEVIALCRQNDFGAPLQYINMKS